MHNGSVSDFTEIRLAICNIVAPDIYTNVLGTTDSEHVAALFVHFLTSGGSKESWEEEYTARQMAEALHTAVRTVIELQKKILGPKAKPNSLNLAVTDGTKMVAYRFRNHVEEQPPSLYYSTTAGVTLNRKYPDHPDGIEKGAQKGDRKSAEEHGRHVIVASEPSTYKDSEWHLIGKNQCLMVDTDGKPELENVPYEEAWNAEDVVA